MYLVVATRIYDPVGSVIYNLSYLYYGSAPLERTFQMEKVKK